MQGFIQQKKISQQVEEDKKRNDTIFRTFKDIESGARKNYEAAVKRNIGADAKLKKKKQEEEKEKKKKMTRKEIKGQFGKYRLDE